MEHLKTVKNKFLIIGPILISFFLISIKNFIYYCFFYNSDYLYENIISAILLAFGFFIYQILYLDTISKKIQDTYMIYISNKDKLINFIQDHYKSFGLKGAFLNDIVKILTINNESVVKTIVRNILNVDFNNQHHPITVGFLSLFGSFIAITPTIVTEYFLNIKLSIFLYAIYSLAIFQVLIFYLTRKFHNIFLYIASFISFILILKFK